MAGSLEQWRALVEKELKGAPFEKALVYQAFPGVAVEPLYTERPAGAWREPSAQRFKICMRATDAREQLAEGADTVWLPLEKLSDDLPKLSVFDAFALSPLEAAAKGTKGFIFGVDPIAARALELRPYETLAVELASLPEAVSKLGSMVVSTLPYHDAGADAADELACALSTAVQYVTALDGRPESISLRVAVGRDTFLELCKLRALRTCWAKLLAGFGVEGAPRLLVHAVCSARTLTVRDPWVNMLRVTTQIFAGVLGGADLVTPLAFDEGLGAPSGHGLRVARNTCLVLREESMLGLVADPAGGSFAFETLTDALAREAWKRFQAMEREGGILPLLRSGRLAQRISETARQRAEQVAKRKIPMLGVSDFANLEEVLPRPAPVTQPPAAQGFPIRRDSWPFEQLRSRADAVKPAEVLLLTLGTFAESRPRAGFARGFFAAGGFKTRETTADVRAPIVCLCGTDESYAAEAAQRAKSLKALGCKQVLLAGRPGANEAALRTAGIDGFLFLGSDVVATLAPLLEVKP
jgi:methylmalonyl-CoA mutase